MHIQVLQNLRDFHNVYLPYCCFKRCLWLVLLVLMKFIVLFMLILTIFIPAFWRRIPRPQNLFGYAPYRWVRWIENHALRILYGDGVRRRILKRTCYLNPQRYQEFRNSFIRSAFQVVDCPPLTTRGAKPARTSILLWIAWTIFPIRHILTNLLFFQAMRTLLLL